MENAMPEFGLPRQKGIFDEFTRKYVMIYYGNNTFGGKLVGIEENHAVLNPHIRTDYRGELPKRFLINERSKVFLVGASIEPKTKGDLEGFCKYLNKLELKKQDTLK